MTDLLRQCLCQSLHICELVSAENLPQQTFFHVRPTVSWFRARFIAVKPRFPHVLAAETRAEQL